MELPQSRSFGAQGTKQTHDFLSLCSPAQQDPRPSRGGFLKTHDFLQPLERVGKNMAVEEDEVEVKTIKKPPPAPPPSLESHLGGRIGTYSISFVNQIPKPEVSMDRKAQACDIDGNDENLSCSYTGSGFTLWEESSGKKGKTGKENDAGNRHVMREVGMKMGGQWLSPEHQSQQYSKSDHFSNALGSLSSSQPSSAQKNQSFIDMFKHPNGGQEEEEDDDDDEFPIKKESSPHPRGNLTVKTDRRSTDQKASTPRSKHSATEQRRRSKINDRFQTLRRLIPNSDQKRDKASFLLEVIDYIQYLQEKVQKYEGSFQGWNPEAPKFLPCRNNNEPAQGFPDQPRGTCSGSGLFCPVKFENNTDSPPVSTEKPADSDRSTVTTFKAMDRSHVQVNKTGSLPVPLQANSFRPGGSSSVQFQPGPPVDLENTVSQSLSQLWQSRSCTNECTSANDKLKEWELAIESGRINISSLYSKGLLNSLTHALQKSGVDLSQTSISVQIDIGKQPNGRLNFLPSIAKNDENPPNNQTRFRVASSEESEGALKRLKTGKS